MRPSRTIARVGCILVAAMLASGCSAIAEKAGEKIAEKGIEAGGGGDAEINFDDDGDGSISMESSEGSFSMGGGEIPDGFPEEVPLPDGFEVESAMAIGSDEVEQIFTLTMTGEGQSDEADALAEDLQSRAEDAGFTITSTMVTDSGGGKTRNFGFENEDWTGGMSVSDLVDEGTIVVALNVAAPREE